MRRGMGIGLVILLVLAGIGIGVAAYNTGLSQGLEESGRAVEVVRVVGHGGFPFGLILFPLFIIGFFALMRGMFWRRWGGPGHEGHWGPGGKGAAFEEWHRRQHEDRTTGGSPPETV
jgi:hypothetical protein